MAQAVHVQLWDSHWTEQWFLPVTGPLAPDELAYFGRVTARECSPSVTQGSSTLSPQVVKQAQRYTSPFWYVTQPAQKQMLPAQPQPLYDHEAWDVPRYPEILALAPWEMMSTQPEELLKNWMVNRTPHPLYQPSPTSIQESSTMGLFYPACSLEEKQWQN